MPHEALALLTTESKERILRQGGSQSWVIDRTVARTKPYLVCVRIARRADTDANEPDGTAFMVGRIEAIVPLPEAESRQGRRAERWKIVIKEYAEIDVPGAWSGSQNPVRYTTLEDLRIDPARLEFRPVPPAPASTTAGLTIQEAKEALARTFGVKPEQIEITIRA